MHKHAISSLLLIFAALASGCATTPLAAPTRSTQTLVGEVQTKIADATATNIKISNAVDVTVAYLTTWLPTHNPAAATQPATVQAVAAAQTAQTLIGMLAVDLGQAQTATVAAGKQVVVDDTRVKALQTENAKLKAADPVKSALRLWGLLAIGAGVALCVGSMFFASVPIIGTYGMQSGVAIAVGGILLSAIAQYFDVLRVGLLIVALIVAGGAVVAYLVTHWSVIREAVGLKPPAPK